MHWEQPIGVKYQVATHSTEILFRQWWQINLNHLHLMTATAYRERANAVRCIGPNPLGLWGKARLRWWANVPAVKKL